MSQVRPGVTVAELRSSFLSSPAGVARGVARGAVRRRLIVRVVNKSHLMYFGRSDRNCDCPYKVRAPPPARVRLALALSVPVPVPVPVQAVLEVWDATGSVCVVLWNSVCVRWYSCLKPGDVLALRGFRVKRRFQAEPEDVGS